MRSVGRGVRRARARPALAEGPSAGAPTARRPRSGLRFPARAVSRGALQARRAARRASRLHRKVAAALERERAQGLNVGAAELASHFELAREPMAALGYYAEAAESALLHFSPAQTLSLTERAMALLPQVEPSAAAAALEMTLATLRGTAAMQVKGFSSPDVKEAFERALSLLDDVPQHPLRGLVLSVLGLAYEMRGELEQAAAIARRSEALWQANGDRTALVCACLVHGLLERDRGRPSIAREWLEKGIRALEELDASTSRAVFVADAGVMMMGLVATELVHLGLVEQGRQRIEAARARALTLREPAPRQAAFWLAALFEVRVGNPERVADAAEAAGADCRRSTTGPRARRPRSGFAAGPRRISATRATRPSPHPRGLRAGRALRHESVRGRNAGLRAPRRSLSPATGPQPASRSRKRCSAQKRRAIGAAASAADARSPRRGCARRAAPRARRVAGGGRRSAHAGSAMARAAGAPGALRAQRRDRARPRVASPRTRTDPGR